MSLPLHFCSKWLLTTVVFVLCSFSLYSSSFIPYYYYFSSQRVAARLKESQNTAAMLTTFQEVDMGNFMEMRHRHKDEFAKKHGVKLGFMSVFVKACTSALQQVPAINAYIDDETKEIVYRDYCDISVDWWYLYCAIRNI